MRSYFIRYFKCPIQISVIGCVIHTFFIFEPTKGDCGTCGSRWSASEERNEKEKGVVGQLGLGAGGKGGRVRQTSVE